MAGIRVDTDWLSVYARQVRAAGEEITEGSRRLAEADLRAEAFGALGRKAGAVASYQRLVALLRDQHARAGQVLTDAGDELREVVDFHAGGDDDSAIELRKQEK